MLTSTKLEELLNAQFPPSTNTWANATDEIRDMSRSARETLGLDETHAIDFRSFSTPAKWNTEGIKSIIEWFEIMSDSQRGAFCQEFDEWITAWGQA